MIRLRPAVEARSRGVQALQVLTRWLRLRPTITDNDLNKICKGLFYTFWHSGQAAGAGEPFAISDTLFRIAAA